MGDERRAALYPIAAVSKLTGVSCHTLRVWERRYGFPVPLRTPSGHRRYGADQVALLREVARRTRGGEPVAAVVAAARDAELTPAAAPDSPAAPWLDELIRPLMAASFNEAEAVYDRLADGRAPAEIATGLIVPALTESGERLFRLDCRLPQERAASFFLLRKLARLFDDVQRANTAPRGLVVTTGLQGDRHEGGALMLGLALELAGWRAVVLGADMPTREIQEAIRAWRPDAVGISLALSRNIRKRFGELSALRGSPVFVGGRSIVNYQGLARNRGLLPVLGPAIPAVARFLEDERRWRGIEPRQPTAPGNARRRPARPDTPSSN